MSINLTAEQIVKRYEKAKAKKVREDNYCREVLEYALPHRNRYDNYGDEGKRDNALQVFDSTAARGTIQCVSNIQSSVIPAQQEWGDLVPGTEIEAEKRIEMAQQLSEVQKTMYAAVHASNFDVQAPEMLTDVIVGTGVMIVDHGDRPGDISNTTVPINEVVLEQGAHGKIDTFWRERKLCARLIKEEWSDAELDVETKAKAEDKEKDSDITLVEGSYSKANQVGTKEVPRIERTFVYVVVDKKSKKILVERESDSSAWIACRWLVLPGDTYGYGPLKIAHADTKTLNKVKEYILKNANMLITGAWTVVDDGVIDVNKIEIEPGALITVQSNPGSPVGATIAPLKAGGDIQVAEIIIADLVKAIEAMLFANPLGDVDLPVKSPTEIVARQQILAKTIGSAFSRLFYEFVIPYINRVLWLLNDDGKIDIQKFKVDNQFIGIKFKSPLAQAQDQDAVNALVSYMQTIATMFPQLAPVLVKPLQYCKILAEKMKVDVNILPTDSEFKQAVAQITQAAAAAQQTAQNGQPASTG